MIPRKKLIRRRTRNLLLLAVAVALCALWVLWCRSTLRDASFSTGYVLFGSVLFLAAYNLRKKLAFIPRLGSSAAWMQLHIYVGLATVLVFALHINFRIPDGPLEIALAGLYLVVALSGVYGLFITRSIPQRLTMIGQEVVFEQIPAFRKQLAEQAAALIASTTKKSETLGRFYVNRLMPFFERRRTLAYAILPSSRQSRSLGSELTQLNRYLSREQQDVAKKLGELIQQKDNLDYHRVMQGRLKLWLFVHIGLTYSLIIVGAVHGLLAHAFAGGG